jgi:hypothetical protein
VIGKMKPCSSEDPLAEAVAVGAGVLAGAVVGWAVEGMARVAVGASAASVGAIVATMTPPSLFPPSPPPHAMRNAIIAMRPSVAALRRRTVLRGLMDDLRIRA